MEDGVARSECKGEILLAPHLTILIPISKDDSEPRSQIPCSLQLLSVHNSPLSWRYLEV